MWFLLALFAGFLFAANRLIVRSILAKGGNPIAFVAVHNMFAGSLLLPAALTNPSVPHTLGGWAVLGLAVIVFFLGDLFAFLSLERIEASIYQILGQVRHIIVLIGGYLLFSEAISVPKIISIALLTTGVIIALVEKSRIPLTRGVIYGVLSPFFISFGFLFIKYVADDVSTGVSAAVIMFFSGLLARITCAIRGNSSLRIPKDKQKMLFLAAAIFAIFEFVLFAALDAGEASKVTPVAQSALLFTLIGGYLFLNERKRLIQKALGCTLIIAGIAVLFFF